MKQPLTHFAYKPGLTLCRRTAIVCSTDTAEVTCKFCQRELAAQVRAA